MLVSSGQGIMRIEMTYGVSRIARAGRFCYVRCCSFQAAKNISLLQHGRRFFVYSSNIAAVTSCEHNLLSLRDHKCTTQKHRGDTFGICKVIPIILVQKKIHPWRHREGQLVFSICKKNKTRSTYTPKVWLRIMIIRHTGMSQVPWALNLQKWQLFWVSITIYIRNKIFSC